MFEEDLLEKNPDRKLIIEKHGPYFLVLDESTGMLFLINETLHFLYENSNGQSAKELCEILFNNCLDKNQLDRNTVYSQCMQALAGLVNMGLLRKK